MCLDPRVSTDESDGDDITDLLSKTRSQVTVQRPGSTINGTLKNTFSRNFCPIKARERGSLGCHRDVFYIEFSKIWMTSTLCTGTKMYFRKSEPFSENSFS